MPPSMNEPFVGKVADGNRKAQDAEGRRLVVVRFHTTVGGTSVHDSAVSPQASLDIPFLFRSDVQTLTHAPTYSAEPVPIPSHRSLSSSLAQAARTTQPISF